jgi:twitching motility protein PilI
MATSTRQSLKNLQERLAARLAEAKKVGAEAAWLAVEAGGLRYLLPLVQAGEIFPLTAIQPVPHTRPWFVGVAALRGNLMGVVSVSGLLTPDSPSPVGAQRQEVKLIAVNGALGVNAALMVDRLVGLRYASMFVGVTPRQAGDPPVCSQRLTDARGEVWQELNLQALVESPEFLGVVA